MWPREGDGLSSNTDDDDPRLLEEIADAEIGGMALDSHAARVGVSGCIEEAADPMPEIREGWGGDTELFKAPPAEPLLVAPAIMSRLCRLELRGGLRAAASGLSSSRGCTPGAMPPVLEAASNEERDAGVFSCCC